MVECSTQQFIGDDLPNLIQINRPSNTDSLTITKSIVQINGLPKPFVEKSPVFPYTISVHKDLSKHLHETNYIHMGICYIGEDGKELFQTCNGELSFRLNEAVIKGVC